jgi:hypothetical protein
MKAAEFGRRSNADAAFVSTNSICQGEQTSILWPLIFRSEYHIAFAYRSFKWTNLASNKAGVTVVIVGISSAPSAKRQLFDTDETEGELVRLVDNIGPYLVPGQNITVAPSSSAHDQRGQMFRGNMPNDGGHLVLTAEEAKLVVASHPDASHFVKSFVGSKDFIQGLPRYCLWIEEHDLQAAQKVPLIATRIEKVRDVRLKGGQQARAYAEAPHKFVFTPHRNEISILVPRHFSERRDFVTVGLFDGRNQIVADSASVIYGATLVDFSLLSSRLHLVWMDTVAGRIKTDYRYSGTLVWNTFPVPTVTEKNKVDLSRCAEDILLAREAHFPATIADLYDPERMPANLREAHEHNDEVLERIYIGRRFRNDTERLEKLFELYAKTALGQRQTKKGMKGASA